MHLRPLNVFRYLWVASPSLVRTPTVTQFQAVSHAERQAAASWLDLEFHFANKCSALLAFERPFHQKCKKGQFRVDEIDERDHSRRLT